jgi:hypothetical protein
MDPIEIVEVTLTEDTPLFEYIPEPIDEYLVIVNTPSDWEEIHNYIIEENEIDGIPNRKIECSNLKEYSVRSSVYVMSREEAEVLRTHPKVESVILNPDKYTIPESKLTNRFKKNVAFNKPALPAAVDNETRVHTNGVRSNWSIAFTDGLQSSQPFQGVGIASTTLLNRDVPYSLTGKGVDAVIIDEGVGAVHPEFLADDGTRRVKDVILDAPYTIDPTYFTSNNLTYTKIIDGVNFGVGIASTAAREWWSDSSKRSAAFSSVGTVGTINSLYTVGHAMSKTSNSDSNQMTGGHGTACASQIGGKSFGHAFECNLWNIRISFGDGYISASTALDICTIFHNAKKISQPGDPNPTLINNSYGTFASTQNTNGVSYSHNYRGSSLSYTGSGSVITIPANAGACRNSTLATYTNGASTFALYGTTNGQFLYPAASSDSSAESAIAAGCVVVASAGNNNQKLADATDPDYVNYYNDYAVYICRAQGVQKGFSGTDSPDLGSIRVGALDCAVEPPSAKQGTTAYSVRKVCYSANGPMIDIWAPAEMTMAAGYATGYEDYQRVDNTNFYDTWFNGTSAAGPNACSVIALYLEANRKATNDNVRTWLRSDGSKEISLADPYGLNDTGYWTQTYSSTFDGPANTTESYNIRGNGNLRGAPSRVLYNPYANNAKPSMSGVSVSGISFTQS